jgi:copper(I)-binding protein
LTRVMLLVILLLMSAIAVGAQMDTDDMATTDAGVVITGVWGRATVAAPMTMDSDTDTDMSDADGMEMGMDMGGTSAVYMTISNPTDVDLRLVAAATDAAGIVEIHETSMGDNDVMQMRPVDGGIDVPAGESVELRPGGFHIMLLEPEALAPGDAFALSLTFETPDGDSAQSVVGVPVLEFPPQPQATIQVDATTIWARPTGSAEDAESDSDVTGGTSAVYMLIANLSSDEDVLVSAATDAAAIVEIHETSMGDNDVMQMRPVDGGIPVPADDMVELRPGGFHVMLLEPSLIVAGDAIAVTLTFDSGEELVVGAVVEDRMMGGMMMDMESDN